MLVELLCLLSVFALIAALHQRSWRKLTVFAVCVALGLLTKETVFPILFCLPLAVILSGRIDLLRSKWIWLAVGLASLVLLALVRSKLQSEFGWHGMRSFTQLGNWFRNNSNLYNSVTGHLALVHPFVFLVVAVGIASGFSTAINTKAITSHSIACAVSTAWILTSVAFGWLLGRFEIRYLMPTIIPLLILFALGSDFMFRLLLPRSVGLAYGVLASVGISAVFSSYETPPKRTEGFSAVAQSIDADANNPVILISSDSSGEGCFIAERLVNSPRGKSIILRASKLLGSSAWSGEGYSLVYKTEAEICRLLQELPVHFVVFDHQAWPNGEPEMHHPLLLRTLLSNPKTFEEVERFPKIDRGTRIDSAISVFRNPGASGRLPSSIEVDMQHSLKRLIKQDVASQAASAKLKNGEHSGD